MFSSFFSFLVLSKGRVKVGLYLYYSFQSIWMLVFIYCFVLQCEDIGIQSYNVSQRLVFTLYASCSLGLLNSELFLFLFYVIVHHVNVRCLWKKLTVLPWEEIIKRVVCTSEHFAHFPLACCLVVCKLLDIPSEIPL